MGNQMLVDTLSRIVHVSTAIALVGGSLFILLVLQPAANQIAPAEHEKLRALIIRRWKMFVHIGIVLFILSGFYNFYRALEVHQGDKLYHAMLGTKILLAFIVFFIGEALVGRSAAFEKMRQNRGLWLTILVVLSFTIVAISGIVKVRGPSKPASPVVASSATMQP